MKTVLVPLSYSEKGHSILQYAFDFAADYSAKIIILKSYHIPTVTGPTPSIEKAMFDRCYLELNEILNQINTKNRGYTIELINGDMVDNCADFLEKYNVDLIISKPKLNKKDAHLYIGHTLGRMIKTLECPILLVRDHCSYKKYSTVSMSIKSGIIKKADVLNPLEEIVAIAKGSLHLLQVKTPKLKEADFEINEQLNSITSSFKMIENETVYQGLLAHLSHRTPDLLCVIRRDKGFFSKLWDQYTVKKADFESDLPLLILKGAIK